ncbi:MAG: class I mannose-6-phosphate isomerase [Phycisphaerales bacterium]|nr:class I mannose-6-phosphate isomerase [Phycisphaerales bacterium]
MQLYPLRFKPVFVPKPWGGRRIASLGRDLPPSGEPIGESWELVDLPGCSSVVSNGPLAGRTLHDVLAADPRAVLGDVRPTGEGGFPLLVKYLDAQQNLSVQVHPDAAHADPDRGIRSKTEAIYILHAEPGAVVYRGIKPGITPQQFRKDIESDRVVEDLIQTPVKQGQCLFLPGGTCHAYGAGIMGVEIQTPGDTTYRLYDWGRTDREMHIDQAMACIDFEARDFARAERRTHVAGVFTTMSKLCSCDAFTIEKVRMVEEYGQEIPYDRPAVWVVLEGEGVITGSAAGIDVEFGSGDVLLLPACLHDAAVKIRRNTVWLDVQFPRAGTDILLA